MNGCLSLLHKMADNQMLNKFRKLVNKNNNQERNLVGQEDSAHSEPINQVHINQSPERIQNKNDKVIDEIPKGRPSVFNLLQKFDKKVTEETNKEKQNNINKLEQSPDKGENKERGSVLHNKERSSALHKFKLANFVRNEDENPNISKEEGKLEQTSVTTEVQRGNNYFKAHLMKIDQNLIEASQLNKKPEEKCENEEKMISEEANKKDLEIPVKLNVIEETPCIKKDEINKETDNHILDNLESNINIKETNIPSQIKEKIDPHKNESISNILEKIRRHKHKSIDEKNNTEISHVNLEENPLPERENLSNLDIQNDLSDDLPEIDDNEEAFGKKEEKKNESNEKINENIPIEQPLPNYESPDFLKKQRLSVVELIKLNEKRVKESLLKKRFTSPNNKYINEEDLKIYENNEINLIPMSKANDKEETDDQTVNYRHTTAENFSENIKEIKNFLKILKEGKQNSEESNKLIKHNSEMYSSSGLMNKIDEEDLLNVHDLINFYEDKVEVVKKSKLFENRLKHRNTVTVLRSNRKNKMKVSVIKEEDEEFSKQHSSKNYR
jgi:hypothetical protein